MSLFSEMIQSGYGTIRSGGTPSTPVVCYGCRKVVSCGFTSDLVIVTGVSGLYMYYCWDCAGYRYQKGDFLPVQQVYEEILRHGVSDVMGGEAPVGMVADRYEEMGLPLIAQYLRNPPAGPITSSR